MNASSHWLNATFLTIRHGITPEIAGFLAIHQWLNAIALDPLAAAQRALGEIARMGFPVTMMPSYPHQTIPLPTQLAQHGFVGASINGVDAIMPPLCDVPAGAFTMGSDKQSDPQARNNEVPRFDIAVPDFRISAYPLTVAEYACAIQAQAVSAPKTTGVLTWPVQQQRFDHPIVGITWHQARAYAAWLASVTGQPWQLPTEAEWEKAARGTDGRRSPWGSQWDKQRANTAETALLMTTPIGSYADKGDASPYGAHDMAGNVWEWMSSIYHKAPPYRATEAENDADTTSSRVFRGGSWHDSPVGARAAFRGNNVPTLVDATIGTRLVCGC